MARQYYKDSTTGQMKPLGVKVEDTLPVGTIVEYNGQDIPEGWVDIGNGKIEKQYQVIPTNAKLENGDSTSATNGYTADYINDHSVVVSAVEPSGSARKKVWLKHSDELFNDDQVLIGYSISSTDGTPVVEANNACSNSYIPVKPNTSYIFIASKSCVNIRLSEYTNSKTHIQRTAGNSQAYVIITTTANTYFVKWSLNYNGSPTTTEIINSLNLSLKENILDKTYILNNDNYEEYTPQNEIYSTNEIIVGKWIDKKPLYRKVINFGTLPNATSKSVAHNISNIDTIINFEALSSENVGTTIKLPYVSTSSVQKSVGITCDLTNINIYTGADRTNYTKTYVTIYYTKTTD